MMGAQYDQQKEERYVAPLGMLMDGDDEVISYYRNGDDFSSSSQSSSLSTASGTSISNVDTNNNNEQQATEIAGSGDGDDFTMGINNGVLNNSKNKNKNLSIMASKNKPTASSSPVITVRLAQSQSPLSDNTRQMKPPITPQLTTRRPPMHFYPRNNVIRQYNFTRENLPAVTILDERPTSYSFGEISIMLIVVVAWSYAGYTLWHAWIWGGLQPPHQVSWLHRRKQPVNKKRKVSPFSNNKTGNNNWVDNPLSRSPKSLLCGVTCSQNFASSACCNADVVSLQSPQEKPKIRTAADLFNEIEGPSTPRPRGLSQIIIVASEDETVLSLKPGRRLRDVIALKQRRNHMRNYNATSAVERSASTSLLAWSQNPEKNDDVDNATEEENDGKEDPTHLMVPKKRNSKSMVVISDLNT